MAISAPSELPAGGGSFTVSVSVDYTEELVAYQVEISFNQGSTPSGSFTLDASGEGDIFDARPALSADLKSGRFSMLNSGAAGGSGMLCMLYFTYDAGAACNYTISLARTMLAGPGGKVIPFDCDSVVLNVGGCTREADYQAPEDSKAADALLPSLDSSTGGGEMLLRLVLANNLYEGDVNFSETVNVLDLIYVRDRLDYDPTESFEFYMADQNRDGNINILDLIYVRDRLNQQRPLHYASAVSYSLTQAFQGSSEQTVKICARSGNGWIQFIPFIGGGDPSCGAPGCYWAWTPDEASEPSWYESYYSGFYFVDSFPPGVDKLVYTFYGTWYESAELEDEVFTVEVTVEVYNAAGSAIEFDNFLIRYADGYEPVTGRMVFPEHLVGSGIYFSLPPCANTLLRLNGTDYFLDDGLSLPVDDTLYEFELFPAEMSNFDAEDLLYPTVGGRALQTTLYYLRISYAFVDIDLVEECPPTGQCIEDKLYVPIVQTTIPFKVKVDAKVWKCSEPTLQEPSPSNCPPMLNSGLMILPKKLPLGHGAPAAHPAPATPEYGRCLKSWARAFASNP